MSIRIYTFVGYYRKQILVFKKHSVSSYHYIDILVNAVLAIIMFGLGLSFTWQDFKQTLFQPKPLITGLSIQIFIIPLIAGIIAAVSGLSPEEQVGIVLVSTCASGASSNLITHLVRGNVPLAVSMTTINSFITLISLPLIVSFAMFVFLGDKTRISLPVATTIAQIFLVAIVPAAAGVFVRNLSTRFADNMEKPLKFVLPILLFAVFAFKIFAEKNQGGSGLSFDDGMAIFPFVLLLNVLAMLAGYLISRMAGLTFQNQFTIAIEVGLHNTALALLVAGTILHSPEMEKPALVYAMFTFFSAFIFIYFVKRGKTFN